MLKIETQEVQAGPSRIYPILKDGRKGAPAVPWTCDSRYSLWICNISINRSLLEMQIPESHHRTIQSERTSTQYPSPPSAHRNLPSSGAGSSPATEWTRQIPARNCRRMLIGKGSHLWVFSIWFSNSSSSSAVPWTSAWVEQACSPCGWHCSRALPTHSPTKVPLWCCPQRLFCMWAPCWMGVTCPGLYC